MPSDARLRQNVVAAMLLGLNEMLHSFRASQSTYLKRLDSRRENVDSFLLTTSSQHSTSPSYPPGAPAAAPSASTYPTTGSGSKDDTEEEELTIDQIQTIMENEHMTKEREQEVRKAIYRVAQKNMSSVSMGISFERTAHWAGFKSSEPKLAPVQPFSFPAFSLQS